MSTQQQVNTLGSSKSRPRQSLSQMLSSSALPSWRERLERTEQTSRTPTAASSQYATTPSSQPLTLEEMLTPAKNQPIAPSLSSSMNQGVIASAMERGGQTARYDLYPKQPTQPTGAYQYDLYPSPGRRQQKSASPPPPPYTNSHNTTTTNTTKPNTFYPADPNAFLLSPLTDTNITRTRRFSPERTNSTALRSSSQIRQPETTPEPSKYAGSVDIPATQKRIQSIIQEQRAAPTLESSLKLSSTSSSSASQPPQPTAATAPAPPAPRTSFPLTASLAASKGARTIEQMKMDVAMRMQDRSHPDHPLNHPVNIDRDNIFHLSRHSSAIPTPTHGSVSSNRGLSHPLPPDPYLGDRRAQSILTTPLTSSIPWTQGQLEANSIRIVQEEKEQQPYQPQPTTQTSFFPPEAILPRSTPVKPAAPQPKSAYLATMHAGALRVEHLLAQPRMKLMLNALIPAQLSRENILAQQGDSPPRTNSHVDQLLHDTIKGRVKFNEVPEVAQSDALSPERPISTMAGYAFPRPSPTTSTVSQPPTSSPDGPFSRASLLEREARLSALLALSSPASDTITRMSYDPNDTQHQVPEAKEVFFDATRVLGSKEELHAATLCRERLVDHHRPASPGHFSSNVEAVLAELLGSPTRRDRMLQVTNMDPVRHEGGVNQILQGVTSPLRQAMAHLPDDNTMERPTSTTTHTLSSSSPPLAPVSTTSYESTVPSAADAGMSISQKEYDYITAATSLSPLLNRAAAHDAYEVALLSKSAAFCFVQERHLLQDAFQTWRAIFKDQQERHRVLQMYRSVGQHGYDAWREQRVEPIEQIRKEQDKKEQSAAPSPIVRPEPDLNSSLLSDVPIRPACVSISALNRKAFVSEESLGNRRELLATIHAQNMLCRRSFKRWCHWSRIERIGKRMTKKTREINLKSWFRNWRDLMRITRGEFHMWVHEKQADAMDEAQTANREVEEQAKLERREQERVANDPWNGSASMNDLPANEHLYARSSPHVKGTIPVAPVTSVKSTEPPRPTDLAPLAAFLSSAATQDQFWLHQEAIFHHRRAEETARTELAELKQRLSEGGEKRATGGDSRASGPLLFQRGTSLHHPSFGVDAKPTPIAQAKTRNYLPEKENISVGLEHIRLSSPIQTETGLLHQPIGQPGFDRLILQESPQPPPHISTPIRVREPTPVTSNEPVFKGASVSFGSKAAAGESPSFTKNQATNGSISASPLVDTPISPVRRHVVPIVSNFGASPPPSHPSATSHGFLPLPLADAANAQYFQSSYWRAPSPATITNEELLQNIAVGKELAATRTQQLEQNKIAQWRRMELEKENYRKRIQEQHQPKEGDE